MRAADRFVLDHWRSLLPTAYLLTGTDDAARDLLARGLAVTRRGDDRAGALAGLVRAQLRRSRREGAITDTTTAAWWASPADAESARRLSAALDRLTPAQRAAVVLRWYEGLHVARVAELVPGADPEAAAAELAAEVPDVADLPARLDGMAAQCDLTALTDETAVAAVAGVGARRRRRAVLAVVVVAALVVGAVLVGTGVAPRIGPQAWPDRTTEAPTEPLFASGPTRGSLAGDETFLDDVLALDGLDPNRPSRLRIVFAGDVRGIRAVLLVAPGGRQTTWLTGPAGTPADALGRLAGTAEQDQEAAATTVSSPSLARAVVLVVAAPGDEVEVSAGIDVAADGSAVRTFRPVQVQDGVAVHVLDRGSGNSAQYRLTRDGSRREPIPVSGGFAAGLALYSVLDGADTPVPSRSGGPSASEFGWSSAVSEIVLGTGYTEAELTVTVLGVGSFSVPDGPSVEAVTVAAVLPTGAVVTSTGAGSYTTFTTAGATTMATSSWASCGSTGYPAGTDPATITVVARCSAAGGDAATSGSVVIVAAPAGASVTLDTAAGGSPVVPVLDNGWAAVGDSAELTRYTVDGATGSVSGDGQDLFGS